MRKILSYAITTTVLLSFFIIARIVITDFAFQELQYVLALKQDILYNDMALSVAANVRLIQRRLENKEHEIPGYQTEGFIRNIESWHITPPDDTASLPSILILLRNFFQLETSNVTSEEYFRNLEYAYWFERHKDYTKAIEEYQSILDNYTIPARERNLILLHKAFCAFSEGDFTAAHIEVTSLIGQRPDEDIYTVSVSMLNLINSLRATSIDRSANPLDRGITYYKLLKYEEAKEILTNVLSNETDNHEARYYLGRILEETGEMEKAISEYKRVILSDSNNWKLLSNRRLLMMDLFYDQPARHNIVEFIKSQDQQFLKSPVISEAFHHRDSILIDSSSEYFIKTAPPNSEIYINDVYAGEAPLFYSAGAESEFKITAQLGSISKTIIHEVTDLDETITLVLDSQIIINTVLKPKSIKIGNSIESFVIRPFLVTPGRYLVSFYGSDSHGNTYLFEKMLECEAGETYTLNF